MARGAVGRLLHLALRRSETISSQLQQPAEQLLSGCRCVMVHPQELQ